MKMIQKFYLSLLIPLIWLQCDAKTEGLITSSVTPYLAFLEKIYKDDPEGIFSGSKLSAVVSSKLSDVKPADIQIWIEDEDYIYWIEIDEEGRFEFPIIDEFFHPKAVIRGNQPKGTINLSIAFKKQFKVTIPDKRNNADYRALMQPLTLANSLADSIKMKKTFNALKVSFQGSVKRHTFIIHTASESLLFESNEEGVCIIPFDQDLYASNPKVTWPIAPQKVKAVRID